MTTIRQEVEPQAVLDARQAKRVEKTAERVAALIADKVANPDDKPVTWGDLRSLGLVES